MSSSNNKVGLCISTSGHQHVKLVIAQQGNRTVMNVSAVAWCCIAEESHTTPVAIIQQMDNERLSHKPKAKPVPSFLKEVNKRVAARRAASAEA